MLCIFVISIIRTIYIPSALKIYINCKRPIDFTSSFSLKEVSTVSIISVNDYTDRHRLKQISAIRRKSPQTRYQMVVFEPFVVLLFAIISVRGSWHASGRGVCEKTIFSLLPIWQERQNRALAKGGAGFDGPKRPHFARHTRRCSTRLFAEALKRCTRMPSVKNKHVQPTSAR